MSGKKKRQVETDWHPADVVAALKKRGLSLRELSQENGYAPDTLKECLRRPYPNAERLVAAALGMKAEEIWPSRYLEAKRERAAA